MTDTDRDTPNLLDTPIMPTGSGVADLEVARELDAIEQDEPLVDDSAAGIERTGANDAGVTASGGE